MRSVFPPADTSVLWAKPVTVNGTELEILHNYDGANWVPASSQSANDVVYSDGRAIEGQQGKLFPPAVEGGLVISDDGDDLLARMQIVGGGTYDRKLIGIDDTVATMWDGNKLDPKVIGWGKQYFQRITMYIPSGSYTAGDYMEYNVELNQWDTLAMNNVSIIQTQSIAKEFYAYEKTGSRVFNSGDLKSFTLRLSPYYTQTLPSGFNMSIDIMVIGWRG